MNKYTLFILLLGSMPLVAQYTNPSTGYIFDDTTIPRVDVLIDTDSLSMILDSNNLEDNHEYPATFIFTKNGDSDTIMNVGFRLRGNTSRQAAKKSFKISINAFQPGRDYRGLEKINLNGEHNDPNIMRSKLCWDLYRNAGIISSRANHVNFYINGEYRGLYMNIEHVDEEFLQKRFVDASGNLYKCLWPADLVFKSTNPDVYKVPEPWGRLAYDLKTNRDADDYSDLAEFIDVLNNAPQSQLVCDLESIFDVDSYLRVVAMDILVANWDGPIFNKNNFYLYHNPTTGKFTYIPYDLDNTFGIDWFGIDWAHANIYDWAEMSGQPRPLFDRLINTPQYRNKINYYFKEFLSNLFNPSFLSEDIERLKDATRSYRLIDTYANSDYDWTIDDYDNSFEFALGGHVPYGLKPYIDTRYTTAIDQLESSDIHPHLIDLNIDWRSNVVGISFEVEDEVPAAYVRAEWKIDHITYMADLTPQPDGSFRINIPTNSGTILYYRFYLQDESGNGRYFPACGDYSLPIGQSEQTNLVINEFMASNSSYAADQFGDFEDWIELFNNSSESLDLNTLFLTDKRSDPGKWELPSLDVKPKEYVIIWLDEDGDQGVDHGNFKLRKSGEFIGLYRLINETFVVIDSLNFGQQRTDTSFARIPNGSGDFVFDPSPSIGENNENGVQTYDRPSIPISIYPNPSSSKIQTLGGATDRLVGFELYSASGKLIKKGKWEGDLSMEELKKGHYFLKLISSEWQLVKKVIRS